MRVSITLIFLLLVATACDRHKGKDVHLANDFAVIKIPSKPAKYNDIPLSSIIDSFYYVPLSNEYLIGETNKIVHYKDKIYILDLMNKCIVIFNSTGKELNRLQNYGKGPGQYTQLFDFGIDKETGQIVVYCYPKKILYFDQNLELLKEERFKFSYQYFAYRNSSFFFQRSYNVKYEGETDNYLLHSFDANLVKTKCLHIPFSNFQFGTTFNYGSPFFESNNELLLCDIYENKAYSLTKDSVTFKYWFDSNDRNMPDGLCLNMKDNFEKLKNYNFGLTNLYETDQALSFSYFQGSQLFVTAIYQKESRELIYPHLIGINDINFLSWGAITKGVKDNFFVQVTEAYSLKKLIDKYKDAIKNAAYANEIEKDRALENFNVFLKENHIDKVKLNDNPILIYYRVKRN